MPIPNVVRKNINNYGETEKICKIIIIINL